MKRTSTVGGGESGHEGNNHNNNKRNNKKHRPHPPPVLGTVATRTRHQQKTNASAWQQPIPILINIMGYADPETIRMLCCVSQQFYDLITNNPGLEHNRVIPLLQISPAEDQEDDKGRIGRLFRFLQHHRDKLQLYREIKFIDVQKFVGFLWQSEWLKSTKITDTLRLYGIVSLDMSSPPLTIHTEYIWSNNLSHFCSLI